MPGLARDDLRAGHALLLGFVREHRARDDVADGVDAWQIRAEMRVDLDAPLIIERKPERFGRDASEIWFTTDGHEHLVGREFQFGAVLARRANGRPGAVDLHFRDLRIDVEFHALGGK